MNYVRFFLLTNCIAHLAYGMRQEPMDTKIPSSEQELIFRLQQHTLSPHAYFVFDDTSIPLISAASIRGHVNLIECLHSQDSDLGSPIIETPIKYGALDGFTPIHLAALNGRVNVMQYLNKNAVLPNPIILGGKNHGLTPLHLAVANAKTSVIMYLKSQNVTACQPLSSNEAMALREIMFYLCKKGCDLKETLQAGPYQGYTRLHLASEFNIAAILDYMQWAGINLDTPITSGPKRGFAPVHIAALQGHLELMDYFKSKRINLNAPIAEGPHEGRAALHLATEIGDLELVSHLIEEHAISPCLTVGAGSLLGCQPLHIAILRDKIDIVQYLIEEANVDPNTKINVGSYKNLTAFTLAELHKREDILSYLKTHSKEIITSTIRRTTVSIPRSMRTKQPTPKSCLLTLTDDDENAGIIAAIEKAVENKTLVIASTALLHALSIRLPLLHLLLSMRVCSIFMHESSRLVVIIPMDGIQKPFTAENMQKQAENLYGLKNLRYIAPEEFEGLKIQPVDPVSLLQTLYDIINVDNSKHPTRFVLSGHGGKNCIANIPLANFSDFCSFLSAINTELLYISSCNAAGINILSIPKTRFPIVIQATTDFVTSGNPEFSTFFSKLHTYLETKTPLDMDALSSIIATSLEQAEIKLPSARLPGEHTFFRSLDTGNMSIITLPQLQALKAQQAELQAIAGSSSIATPPIDSPTAEPALMATHKKDESSEIRLHMRYEKFLQTFVRNMTRLAIEMDLFLNPLFISKIPGQAHHFIGTVRYNSLVSPTQNDMYAPVMTFIHSCFLDFFARYFHNKPLTNKGWFIKNLYIYCMDKQQVSVNDFILYLSPQTDTSEKVKPCSLFRNGNHYYLSNKGQPFEHVPYTQAIDLQKTWYTQTAPSKDALHEASGGDEIYTGQQCDPERPYLERMDYQKPILSHVCQSIQKAAETEEKLLQSLDAATDSLQGVKQANASRDLSSQVASAIKETEEKRAASLTLLSKLRKQNDDFLPILQHICPSTAVLNALDPETGQTPLHSCIQFYQADKSTIFDMCAQYLVNQGANPNIADAKGMTSMHYAIQKGNERLIDLFRQAAGESAPAAEMQTGNMQNKRLAEEGPGEEPLAKRMTRRTQSPTEFGDL